jgi:hypothetical protein
MGARRLTVAEDVHEARMSLHGERALEIDVHVEVPTDSAAGWRYADPDGAEHDVVNCSVAHLGLAVTLPGEPAPVRLETTCGGAYELGMREHDHGVPIAPFPDG